MFKSVKLLAVGVPLLVLVAFFSYSGFEKYSPKVLRQLEEVKGLSDSEDVPLPFPRGSSKIGYSRSSEANQMTFRTNLKPKAVQDFYKNVFSEQEWRIDSEGQEDSFLVSKYKSEDFVVTVRTTWQETQEFTIASVDVAKR